MYLLDTNVVSEVRKAQSGKADANVLAWMASVPPQLFYISAITLFELELGILQIERRDPQQGRGLRRWMEESVKETFRGRIIAADDRIAIRSAASNVPDPRPLHDSFIGATAMEYGFTLVTRNLRDFQGLNIQIVNPWSPSA